MTDFTHEDLIALAEGEPGPGSKTYELIPMAVKLLLPRDGNTLDINTGTRLRVSELLSVYAETDACIALMGEVLPGWTWSRNHNGVVRLFSPADMDWGMKVTHADIPRAFLLAILRAHREVAG